MRHLTGRTAVVTAMLLSALTFAQPAGAHGVVNIDTCQTLDIPNTVYRLTTDLMTASCPISCLRVAADKITIDLQGHSITRSTSCPASSFGISDLDPHDVIVVKNGSISGFDNGVQLVQSTRVSVLGVTATNNTGIGINVGPQGLVKSSEASGNDVGIRVGPRGQVQQCNSHHNSHGIQASDNCLITMNTANFNSRVGIDVVSSANKCTVSYNTANNNSDVGINLIGGARYLLTRNVALRNSSFDYVITCPSDVTFNTSTNGPASYEFFGSGCQTVGND